MKVLLSLVNIASSIVLMATLALVSTPPAHAQSASASASPDDSQYVDCNSGVAVEGCSAAALGDGVEAMGETASQGTAVTNEALGSPTADVLASSPPSPVRASASAASTASRKTTPSDDGTDGGEGPPGVEVLPETGGAPLPVLCAGVCLLGCGLLLARLAFV